MRTSTAILTGALLASCSAVPPTPTRTAEAQRTYEQLLAGKVAQRPINCLPSYRAEDMVRIDDETVAFRNGGTVYVARMRNACTGLTSPQTALVTHETVGGGPCSGDIAQVLDTSARMPVGSCTWGDFVPYTRPRT